MSLKDHCLCYVYQYLVRTVSHEITIIISYIQIWELSLNSSLKVQVHFKPQYINVMLWFQTISEAKPMMDQTKMTAPPWLIHELVKN